MTDLSISRRDILKSGSVAAGLGWLGFLDPSFAFPAQAAEEELVPFLNMPRSRPGILDWETLDSWLTPDDQVFSVSHYDKPQIAPEEYQLEITGLVERPKTFTLEEIRALPQVDQLMTLECAGNGVSKGFMGAIYNSRWTGTPLAPLLEECGLKEDALEVVFIGTDRSEETLRKGTKRETTFEVPFGRSLSVEDAMQPELLLAYERNGEPLRQENGAPLRLIAPGRYGIANVKWLKRIEVRDRRYMGRYMARDYVTVRGERRGDDVVFVETSVLGMNLKSIIARVTRQPAVGGMVPVKAYGAVWNDGTPIDRVEVRVDDGQWQQTTIDAEPYSKYCWRFFSIDLGRLSPEKHTVVSRAIDVNGRVQPTAEDDEIALKRTYWEAYEQWPREIDLSQG